MVRIGEQFFLYQTRPPPWGKMNWEQWREHWREHPLRLRINCRAAGVDLPPVYRSVDVKDRDADRNDSQGSVLDPKADTDNAN